MASLTRQLLAFSRQQILRPETLDLNAAVADSQSLLQRLIGTDIEMLVQLGSGAKWVQVDRAQLLQVLMNLAINARDAMPGGGELVIRTEARHLAPGEAVRLPVSGVTPGRWATLTVSDTGVGIAQEHLAHIFEPFFTTKGVGEGTGLGLATVHGIIAQSRGHIWVESTPDRGTTFTVLLPLVKEPSTPRQSAGDGDAPGARPARVLVVDDEEVVQRIVGRMLEEEGYTVRSARNGEEALSALEDPAGPVDLMVSDVVMPGLGGAALRDRLAARYPGLSVIWISGYPRDTAFPGAAMPPEQAFLEKPVSAEVLLATARELIGRSGLRGSG
jgi:CheY-like chemotaxis protein